MASAHQDVAYQELLYAAKTYRNSLVQISKTASSFGTALERCARCKGVGEEEMSGFMLAGGLQYLIANHQQILSETLYRRFEIPLMEELDTFRAMTQERDDRYQRLMMEKNKKIQEREAEHLRMGRKKQRDLATFRQALVDLSRLADDLERLKSEHYNGALDTIHETWSRVLNHTALITRAEVDIYEGIARKGWSGGGLEEIMARCEDPFNTGQGEASMAQSGHGEIYRYSRANGGQGSLRLSILPSHSILTSPQSPIFNEGKIMGQYKSLTRTFSNEEFDEYNDEDSRSIFSSDIGKYKPIMNDETSRYEGKNAEMINLSSSDLLKVNQKIQSMGIDILNNENVYYNSDGNELKSGFCAEAGNNNPSDIHST